MYTKKTIRQDWRRNRSLYLMIIPVLAYYILFHYVPMYGTIIAFKNYSPGKGIFGSPWVGFKNFIDFFEGKYFGRTLANTLNISIKSIIFGFPAPIILALLINDLSQHRFAKIVQTVTYMPHFISLVVVCGLVNEFVGENGIVNVVIEFFGGTRSNLLQKSSAFVPIYITTTIWQEIGWSSIIYIAALTGVDQSLCEAAALDGAGRFKQTIHIFIPWILPTIITMFILKLGKVMNVGYEKIILLYNSMTYDKADVISTYVYRMGLQEFRYGYSTAVGLFNSVINLMLIIFSNGISRKLSGTSLW